jgi:DNA-binding transcriptional LysR family regulator
LGDVPRIVCASPAYLRRHGAPQTPGDLRDHACLRFTGLTPGREWTFMGEGREIRVAIAGRFACNVVEPAIDVARNGGGMLMALGYQVAEDIAAGRLVRVLRPFETPPLPINVLFLSPRLMAARVRVFLDLLTQRLPQRLAPAVSVAAPAVRKGRRS